MIKIEPQVQCHRSPYLYMQFAEPLGNADSSVDAAWDYVNHCWRPDVLEVLKRLAPPMIRWGGCFASYYHWRDAVGPREQRKPMLNLCWDGVFSNQIGTAEFVDLCRALGAEPLMCVNMESDGRPTWAEPFPGANFRGSAEEAAEWVAYCNDPADTLRRSHGRKEPFGIRYWQIGNETSYGYWTADKERKFVRDGFDCSRTIEVTRRFAKAMRAVDPTLKLIAWGDDNWTPRICEELGELIDMVAFHCHFPSHRDLENDVLADHYYRQSPQAVWNQLMNTCVQLERKIEAMKMQAAPYGKHLAMTESHYCIDDGHNRGDVLSCWAAGVAYARNLNVVERHADVLDIATSADFFGNRWQVNAVMLPTPAYVGKPYLMPVGEVMRLFCRYSGEYSVPVECGDAAADVTASMTGDKIYLHIVNTSADQPLPLSLRVAGRTIGKATAWEIAASPWAEVSMVERDLFRPNRRTVDPAAYRLPPAGVAALVLELENSGDCRKHEAGC